MRLAQLSDGTRLDGPAGLRSVLIQKADVFRTAFTEKLLTYALGRGVASYDMPAVRTILRSAGQRDHRFSAYVLGDREQPAVPISPRGCGRRVAVTVREARVLA